jgi:hypothetical protein
MSTAPVSFTGKKLKQHNPQPDASDGQGEIQKEGYSGFFVKEDGVFGIGVRSQSKEQKH